jgi:hypothetical protein
MQQKNNRLDTPRHTIYNKNNKYDVKKEEFIYGCSPARYERKEEEEVGRGPGQ